MNTRKVIQICTDSQPGSIDWDAWVVTTALCDDGTIWELGYNSELKKQQWKQLIEIPQDNEVN